MPDAELVPASEAPVEMTERVQRIIWRSLGLKSARQIANETGLKPEQVLAAKRDLLDSVDVLTLQEKRAKLIVDLQDIAQRVQDDYDSAPYTAVPVIATRYSIDEQELFDLFNDALKSAAEKRDAR